MIDIVERLRREADGWDKLPENIDTDLWREAADEIERLRSLAGKADVGPSFAEMTDELRHQTPHGPTGW